MVRRRLSRNDSSQVTVSIMLILMGWRFFCAANERDKCLERISELELDVEIKNIRLQQIQRESIIVAPISDIFFEKGRSDLSSYGLSKASDVAQALREDPGSILQIRGYGSEDDMEGDPGPILRLSQDRAEAVAHALVLHGASVAQIPVVVGMGVADPMASNDTESGRAQNRRVEITIIPTEG